MHFSIMFFASGKVTPQETCRSVLEASRLADLHGLSAVWTPERHFDEFGSIFPNPAVTSAALATVTKRIQLRAGSLISPLHQTIRIAEDWSVVDNWSGGRAAVSFGSGWNTNDFILSPDAYSARHQIMLEQITTVRSLWRGQEIKHLNGTGKCYPVRLHPQPIQTELPIWITSSGNPRTFEDAGSRGLNILTHLITQDLNELAEKIELYRKARTLAGFDPSKGIVSLMLHTHLDTDPNIAEIRCRTPFREYLRSAVKLEVQAAKGGGTISGSSVLPDDDIPQDLIEDLLDITYERYRVNRSLIGSPNTCQDTVDRVKSAGVDDIACLVDFGVPTSSITKVIPLIAKLADSYHLSAGQQ